jgi:hypothetical protein
MASGTQVFELEDTSSNDKGIWAIWWSDTTGTPWTRDLEVWRVGPFLPTSFKLHRTTAYGSITGGTTSARRDDAQDIWDEYQSETGYSPGTNDKALEYVGDIKPIPDFDI